MVMENKVYEGIRHIFNNSTWVYKQKQMKSHNTNTQTLKKHKPQKIIKTMSTTYEKAVKKLT